MVNTLFLTMGGVGSRFGSEIPKQFTMVSGRPVFRAILDAYVKSELIDNYVILCNPLWMDYAKSFIEDLVIRSNVFIVPGGSTRSQSIINGVNFIRSFSNPSDNVLIHDSTHPYLDKNATLIAIEKMSSYSAVTLCQNQYDTCYSIDCGELAFEIPKKTVVSGASPEIFKYSLLLDLFCKTDETECLNSTSIGALAVQNGHKVAVVPMSLLNLKLTYPSDYKLFMSLNPDYYFEV